MLLLILALAGCGNSLKGEYYQAGILDRENGEITKPVIASLWDTHFEFNKDGTVQCYNTARESYPGTYKIDDGRIFIYIEDGQGTTLTGSTNDSSELEKYYVRDDYYGGKRRKRFASIFDFAAL